jgi:hypothetical protein
MPQTLILNLKICVLAACVALSGCATALSDETELAVVMPSRSTSASEVTSAIQELIKTYPVCVIVRPLRLVGRPSVDFDRAEGARYEDAEEELDALVRLGYLTKTALPDLGKRVFRFDRTERGKDTNVIQSGSFCLPAERVLVSVTNIRREAKADSFGTGYLIVDFTHTLDPQSVWAQEPALAKLMPGDWVAFQPGPIEGRALLSRVWMRSEHSLKGAPHSGVLWAVSWDAVHNRWEGGRWGAVSLKLWRPAVSEPVK